MTYREKLKNSTVVKTGLIHKSYFRLMKPEKRLKTVVVFLLLALYTILTKFVFKTIEKFDIMYVILIINLISLFVLRLIAHSVFSLNHIRLYKAVFFINRVCKLVIFSTAFVTSTAFFLDFFRDYQVNVIGNAELERVELFGMNLNYLPYLWEFDHRVIVEVINGFKNSFNFSSLISLFKEYNFGLFDQVIPYITRMISIVLFVPIFFYFLGIYFTAFFRGLKYIIIAAIPIFNIYYYCRWLFAPEITFVSYSNSEDPKFVKKEYRALNPEAKSQVKSEVRALRFLYSLFVLAIIASIAFVGYTIFNTVKNVEIIIW